ncbi:iron transporter [Actinorhabdospora filicis]|uniref:Iron transporter n=1 Tax=Actinorhabdospora filicis TaxID=1785913 RepID=A0A9W6WD59_9ACTN|nr:iron uptake transporter permease EfeU [Actinorhabdospora filicis]GLZ81773.1 iron transporter [Actinorhabdospora filicis]
MPNLGIYLIGLREGLEATLVVSILVAFVVKAGRRDRLPLIWAGVGAAVALSVLFGGLLTYTETTLLKDPADRELFEAITSVLAVVFVTWMIFWMRKVSRKLKGELTAKLAEAITVGGFAVLLMAFLSVVREGIETSLIFYAAAANESGLGPLWALTGGLVTSIVIGVLLYLGAVRVNLGKFFTWTGAILVFVAGGIFKYGVHDFQEAGVLPGLHTHAFDITSWFKPTEWYAELVRGLLNFTPQPTVLETIAWAAYIVPVLLFFLWPAEKTAPKPVASDATPAKETV